MQLTVVDSLLPLLQAPCYLDTVGIAFQTLIPLTIVDGPVLVNANSLNSRRTRLRLAYLGYPSRFTLRVDHIGVRRVDMLSPWVSLK